MWGAGGRDRWAEREQAGLGVTCRPLSLGTPGSVSPGAGGQRRPEWGESVRREGTGCPAVGGTSRPVDCYVDQVVLEHSDC